MLSLKRKLDAISFRDEKVSGLGHSTPDRASIHASKTLQVDTHHVVDGVNSEDAKSFTISPIRSPIRGTISDKLETLGCPTESHQSEELFVDNY